MSDDYRSSKSKLLSAARKVLVYWNYFWRLLRDQYNKNIYTRIIFTNVTVIAVGLVILMLISSFVVKQATYQLAEEELLEKAKRVNYAFLELTDQLWGTPFTEHTNGQTQDRQDFIKFLADIYDTRITIFDREGAISDTSARQEVGPGSKVENKFLEVLNVEEITIVRTTGRETGQLSLAAVVPLGNDRENIQNWILLEMGTTNLDFTLNRLYLAQVIGGALVLTLLIIISTSLSTNISRPISGLTTRVGEIGSGSNSLKMEECSLDEINTLSQELSKLEQKVQKIQLESRKMEEDRSRLFAEISHELRTPLTAVQGFIEAIRDGLVKDQTVYDRYLDTIYQQTVHITRLVDDILALSRLESGTVTVDKLPVDLSALAGGVAASMEEAARRKNNLIRLDSKAESAVVLGDADRIEQIIRNLLKNAINATENGTIRVGVETEPDQVLLTVEDSGAGISPEDLPHIWDRFFRVRTQHGERDREKGTGLGLVIVKKLVQLQEGNIEVASKPGQGTTFRITFPPYPQG
ncbi:MAG: HAMP domain-containing sensor histidine kinase [Bacillota bacterium]|nr:HAMP domain-containing sensor histidine kinase [Bacillota bacterium]